MTVCFKQRIFRDMTLDHTSASSREVCSSDFSPSTVFFPFSSSWMVFPVSPICSVRSEISSVRKRVQSIYFCLFLVCGYLATKCLLVCFIDSKYVFTLQVLVLSLEGLKVVQSFFIRVLHLEHLSAQRASLFLSSLQLGLALLIFLLPLSKNLQVQRKHWVSHCIRLINVFLKLIRNDGTLYGCNGFLKKTHCGMTHGSVRKHAQFGTAWNMVRKRK